MKTIVLAGSGVLMLALALPGSAATPAPAAPPAITLAAVKAEADRIWERLDVNHDGKIDAADRDVRLLERFAASDTNHDGVISKDEFLAWAHAREARWHGDHPGAGGPPPPPPPGADGPLPPPPPPGHDHGGPHGPGHHPGAMVGAMLTGAAMHDADSAGVITRAAFDAALAARFARIDTNHDGQLDRAELRAALRAAMARGEGWGHGPHHPGDGPPPPPPPGMD